MTRYFNNKEIELLAPAGNMETFKRIVQANCDAIYLGGKSFNMRLIRKGYNFSDEELSEAINMAHDLDKKVYITVNNMMNDEEMNQLVEYLHFLREIKPDGLIVQDPGILQVCKEENINEFELHSSVMMNVHNIEFVKALQEFGVTRVVVSREMDLQTAKQMQEETGIEIEYFVHGDMCTVNGGNCYYSSLVLGNSSNRGRCFKPCRWAYKAKKDGKVYDTKYPLAAKDMYMYENIPELIESRITSFKIEGRMREADFIVNLVNQYGDAIDRYIADPLSFDRKQGADELYENRKRDFSTAYAFGNPGLSYINTRYEGTGKFYSTGKMFSTPTEETEINEKVVSEVKNELNGVVSENEQNKLSVKVNNFGQAKRCIELGVDRIYLPTEVYAPDHFVTLEELRQLTSMKGKTEIYLDLPQMMTEIQFEMIEHYLEKHGQYFDGLLVSNLGAVHKFAGKFPLISNFNMNINNQKAAQFYQNLGVKETTVSIEAKLKELKQYLELAKHPVELIVHGSLKAMYLDLNLYENTEAFDVIDNEDNLYVNNDVFVLKTDKGENPVYIDQFKKNHLYTSKELCLLPILHKLKSQHPISYRIEGQTYSLDELERVIKLYQDIRSEKENGEEQFMKLESARAGFTLGALSFK